MTQKIEAGLSYNDVLLIPDYSDLESRGQSSIKTSVGKIQLNIPIVSSPMDTVTEENMAVFMWEKGGLGTIHRYMSINKQFAQVKWVKSMGCRVGAAIGVNGDTKERVEALVEADVDMLVIDIAHGYSESALSTLRNIKASFPDMMVMSGNVVTDDAAIAYAEAGADVIRIGIGAGSACTTRIVAGVGYPQFSAIQNIRPIIDRCGITCVADGGIKNSGDVVKALAAGADAVMLGGLLAPFRIAAGEVVYMQTKEESPVNEVFPAHKNYKEDIAKLFTGQAQVPEKIPQIVAMKQFRGMASDAALSRRGKENYVVEGEQFMVPVSSNHEEFVKTLVDGITTGLSYCGARDLEHLREVARFVSITTNGYNEGEPNFNKGVIL